MSVLSLLGGISVLSLFGGMSAKLYDDIYDNNNLNKFKNEYFMEFLKGVHFIAFSSISIEDPLFFIVLYIADILNHLANDDAFNSAYEYSLFFSFFLLFFIVDYNKITYISFIDYLLLFLICVNMYTEPIIMKYFVKNSEFSFAKLIIRSILFISSIICYTIGISKTTQNVYLYFAGYFIISIIVQCYSLCNKTTDTANHDTKDTIKDNINDEEQVTTDSANHDTKDTTKDNINDKEQVTNKNE
jgi:hypothetical protein